MFPRMGLGMQEMHLCAAVSQGGGWARGPNVPSRTDSSPGAGSPRRAALAWGEGLGHTLASTVIQWKSSAPLVRGEMSLSAEGKQASEKASTGGCWLRHSLQLGKWSQSWRGPGST